MSESCTPNTHFSTLVISDLIIFCSYVFSHPLYFSYFIFFLPYLLKLILFLSPLFITTLLLVLAFLTRNSASVFPIAYVDLLEKSYSAKNDENEEFLWSDDFELYEIVFGSVNENPVEVLKENQEEYPLQESESAEDDSRHNYPILNKCEANKIEKNSVPAAILENSCAEMEEKRSENFLTILGKFERMSSSSPNVEEEKKSEPPSSRKISKVVEKQKTESMVKDGSEAKGNKLNDVASVNVGEVKDNTSSSKITKSQSQRVSLTSFDSSNETLGNYGSMRKEKEWKRTLACKLFEERHNGNRSEGMDSLWETYESDSVKLNPKNGHNKNKKKSEVEVFGHEEEEIGAQLCCLQALKMSAGKMNLGMKKPSLVKISKAIKGLGWLHGVSKHSKKVHNNGDRSY